MTKTELYKWELFDNKHRDIRKSIADLVEEVMLFTVLMEKPKAYEKYMDDNCTFKIKPNLKNKRTSSYVFSPSIIKDSAQLLSDDIGLELNGNEAESKITELLEKYFPILKGRK